jgi:hypothetical protein
LEDTARAIIDQESSNLLGRLTYLMNLTFHHITPYLTRKETQNGYNRNQEVDLNAVAAYICFRTPTPTFIAWSDTLKDIDNALICFYLDCELAEGQSRVIDLTHLPVVLYETLRRTGNLEGSLVRQEIRYHVHTEPAQTPTLTIGSQLTGTTASARSSRTSSYTERTEVPDKTNDESVDDDSTRTIAYDPVGPAFSFISTQGPSRG